MVILRSIAKSQYYKMKRVLIITYYWPPSGGSGVQRWLKFSKYLPENGWTPVIYTPENPDFDLKDESLESDVHEDTIVVKRKILEPYKLAGLFGKGKSNAGVGSGPKLNQKSSLISRFVLWIRGNIFIPDPRILWVSPSVRFLKKYLEQNPVDIIISTGPPHSMHLIAEKLKDKMNIPWIADFRDPLSTMDVYDEFSLTARSKQKLIDMEHRFLNKSDLVLTVTPRFSEMLVSFDKQREVVLTNGFDPDDFLMNESYQKQNSKKFTLLHAGTLGNVRDPKGLWQALSELSRERSNLVANVMIKFVGNVSPEIIAFTQNNDKLKDKVQFLGYMSRKELQKLYAEADALLLAIHSTAVGRISIPGKVFEYLATSKPIICLGDITSDASMVIKEAKVGQSFEYNDAAGVKNYLVKLLSEERSVRSLESLNRYSRRKLTKDLSTVLNDISGKSD
jgi:glycosyltransferase involved in cell wall biosynthesis